MTRYTVTYHRAAISALAREWLDASDRRAVTQAGDEIERVLAVDATQRGEEVREGLRRLVIPPLQVLFTIDEDDRKVTIWRVRTVPQASGSA